MKMLGRVRYWDDKRTGKADGVGTITQGPMWALGMRVWYVARDGEHEGRWYDEAHLETELSNGAGVKA
jgi:hypothetical protein